MSKKTVDLMIEGGKAAPSAQLGQSFGPLGVNIPNIINEINKKTAEFKGMKLPVKVIIETTSKTFELEIGTPPVSELIKKEAVLQKGSGESKLTKVGNLAMEQVIKIAKMKQDSMLVNNLKSAVKNVVGSCGTLGVLVESKEIQEVNKDIDNGLFDDLINKGVTELSEEKRQRLRVGLEEVQTQLEKEKALKAAEEAKKEEAKAEVKEEGKEAEVKKEEKQEGAKGKVESKEKKEEPKGKEIKEKKEEKGKGK